MSTETLSYSTTSTAAARRWPQWVQLVPGTLLLAVVGFAGKVTEQSIAAYGRAHHVTLPNIEYVLWAIIFGLVVANTVGIPAIFRAGVETYEFWLKAGIVLLGVRFLIGDIVLLGSVSLACVAIELVAADTVSRRSAGRSGCRRASGRSDRRIAACPPSSPRARSMRTTKSACSAMRPFGAGSRQLGAVFPSSGALGMSDHAWRTLGRGFAVDNTAGRRRHGIADAAGEVAMLAKIRPARRLDSWCLVARCIGEEAPGRRDRARPRSSGRSSRSFCSGSS